MLASAIFTKKCIDEFKLVYETDPSAVETYGPLITEGFKEGIHAVQKRPLTEEGIALITALEDQLRVLRKTTDIEVFKQCVFDSSDLIVRVMRSVTSKAGDNKEYRVMNNSISRKTYRLLVFKMINGIGSVALWRGHDMDEIETLPLRDVLMRIHRFHEKITDKELDTAIEKANQIVAKAVKFGDKIISYFDNDYPAKLRNAGNKKAPLLFCRGDVSLLNRNITAVIGSRQPVGDSVERTKGIVTELVKKDVVVLSGLAEGIDTVAHETTLALEGKTIAVIGTGLNRYYPKENRDLSFNIGKKGLLVSEVPYSDRVDVHQFITRDFTQALLSDNLILIQTGTQGGSLHATKATLFLNKFLFVVSPPLNEFNDNFFGNNILLNTDEDTIKSLLNLKHVNMTLIHPL